MEVASDGVTQSRKPVSEALTMGDIYTIGNRYEDPQSRALFFLCYLTGARISEALAVTPRDINTANLKGLGDCVTVRLLTRKNKKVPIRDVPVLMAHKEGEMMAYVSSYISVEGPAKTDKIFGHLTRTNAWNKLTSQKIIVRALHGRKILEEHEQRINPHYLRHCRLTHLVQHYGLNDIQLMRFAGWSNTKPAIVYVHLNWMDLARVMQNAQAMQNDFPWGD